MGDPFRDQRCVPFARYEHLADDECVQSCVESSAGKSVILDDCVAAFGEVAFVPVWVLDVKLARDGEFEDLITQEFIPLVVCCCLCGRRRHGCYDVVSTLEANISQDRVAQFGSQQGGF